MRATPDAGTVAYADLVCAPVRMAQLDAAHEIAAACRRRYPDDYLAPFLASWVAAKRGMTRLGSDCWEDIAIDDRAGFDPSIVADWIDILALHA